jgi:peroxiredoxin
VARKRKWIQVVILLLFVIVVGFTIFQSLNATNQEPLDSNELLSKKAPTFIASGINGQQYRLDEFKGKPVMLNFWASWCAPCRAEMPLLNQKYNEHHQKDGLMILGINIGENAQTIKGFVNQFDLSFPILLDNNAQIESQYGIDPIPATFFIDREGIIQDIHLGELKEDVLDQYLQKIL